MENNCSKIWKIVNFVFHLLEYILVMEECALNVQVNSINKKSKYDFLKFILLRYIEI
jgi:hypothetical protein